MSRKSSRLAKLDVEDIKSDPPKIKARSKKLQNSLQSVVKCINEAHNELSVEECRDRHSENINLFDKLPFDVKVYLLQYLSPENTGQLCRLSSEFNKICISHDYDRMWHTKLHNTHQKGSKTGKTVYQEWAVEHSKSRQMTLLTEQAVDMYTNMDRFVTAPASYINRNRSKIELEFKNSLTGRKLMLTKQDMNIALSNAVAELERAADQMY